MSVGLTQVHHETDHSATDSSGRFQVFDVHPLTNVGLDTYVQLTDLTLVQGATYQVMVIAVDESGVCVETVALVTVDITPPLGGEIGVGPHTEMVSNVQLLLENKFTFIAMHLSCVTFLTVLFLELIIIIL